MKKILGCLAALCLVASSASASTILQFTENGGFNTPFAFNGNGTTTTITASKAVNVVFDPFFCLNIGCNGATDGVYQLNLTANSIGAATWDGIVGHTVTQAFGGTISVTQGAINLLTVNFTDLLQGSQSGGSPTLQASQPPDLFSGTSNVIDPNKLGIPRGFALSFSNLSGGGLGVNGTSVRSGFADASGTFSAEPISTVPEPASMVLFGTGLLGIVRMARKRRA